MLSRNVRAGVQVSEAVAATGAALSEGRGQGFFDPLGPGVFCAPPRHPTPITHHDFGGPTFTTTS